MTNFWERVKSDGVDNRWRRMNAFLRKLESGPAHFDGASLEESFRVLPTRHHPSKQERR